MEYKPVLAIVVKIIAMIVINSTLSSGWIKQIYSSTGLTSLPADIWSNVTYLDLSGNELTTIDTFPIVPDLRYLKLELNKLVAFPNLGNLNKLEYLLLQLNQIAYINPQFLMALPILHYLNLNDNRLTSFPDVYLPEIRYLGLGDMKVTTGGPRICKIVPETHVIVLYAHGNDILNYPKDAFLGCSQIREAVIKNHKIRTLASLQDFGETVEVLDVGFNLIPQIDKDVHLFKMLQRLILDGNPLVKIPNVLMMPPTLLELSIINYNQWIPNILPCDFPELKLINTFRQADLPLTINLENSLDRCFDSPEKDADFSAGLAVDMAGFLHKYFTGNTVIKTHTMIDGDKLRYGLLPAPLPLVPGMRLPGCARACRLLPACALIYITPGDDGGCGLTDAGNFQPNNGTNLKYFIV